MSKTNSAESPWFRAGADDATRFPTSAMGGPRVYGGPNGPNGPNADDRLAWLAGAESVLGAARMIGDGGGARSV